MMKILLAAIVVLVSVGVGEAVTCYACVYGATSSDSKMQRMINTYYPGKGALSLPATEKCKDEFNKDDKNVRTQSNCEQCMKAKVTKSDKQFVVRACLSKAVANEVCSSSTDWNKDGYTEWQECCTGDKCNGAPTVTLRMASLLLPMAALFCATRLL